MASVRVVHGIGGVVADVYFDSALVLQTFQPETSTDLFEVDAGPHTVDIRLAGSLAAAAPLLSGRVDITPGKTWSLVAHLAADGKPTLTAFADDVSQVPPGQTRVVIRHTAAAPPIDVLLSAAPIASNLANPGEISTQVAAGTYQVSVTQAGTAQALAPAQDVPFQEGTANDMYFIGDANAGTLGWIAVQTTGLQSAPLRVQTGNSGLAANRSPIHSTPLVPLAIALAAIALLTSTVVVRRLRRA
jgi:Domain of unknown function (DUF4397)